MRARIVAFAGLLAIALLLVPGGAAGSQAPNKLNLTSLTAINEYLRSIGIDPATVVKQTSLLNYAGPNCPGLGWNCTTATKVVQLSLAGGENRTECSGKPEGTTTVTQGDQTCFVLQASPAKGENHAKCSEQSDDAIVVQQCTIIQDNASGGNHADVNQQNYTSEATSSTTPEQDGRQFAHVVQDSDGGNNVSDVHQTVKQSLTVGGTQTQDGHQVAFVEQTVTGSSNFSHVHQSQDQLGSGAASIQDQNTETAPTIAVGEPPVIFNFDCGPEKVAEPNQCANVFQDGTSDPEGANNESHLHQAIGERQTSTVSSGSQTQGRSDGGQEGNVHQQNPDGLGSNHDAAHQDARQRQSSPTGTKFQQQLTDPGCCGISQVGAAINRENIDQATTQSSTQPSAYQLASLFGQVHQVSDPENTCRIDQHGRNNTDAAHFSASETGALCANLILATECTSGGESAGTCQAVDPCSLNPSLPECDSLELSIATAPTFGRAITMPDYDAEPSDYVPPPST